MVKKKYITPKTKAVKVMPTCMLTGSEMNVYHDQFDKDATEEEYPEYFGGDTPIGEAW